VQGPRSPRCNCRSESNAEKSGDRKNPMPGQVHIVIPPSAAQSPVSEARRSDTRAPQTQTQALSTMASIEQNRSSLELPAVRRPMKHISAIPVPRGGGRIRHHPTASHVDFPYCRKGTANRVPPSQDRMRRILPTFRFPQIKHLHAPNMRRESPSPLCVFRIPQSDSPPPHPNIGETSDGFATAAALYLPSTLCPRPHSNT